jgi:hypothetical protein
MSTRSKLLSFCGLIFVATLLLSGPAAAKDTAYASYDDWWWTEGYCYWHDEWSDETPTMDARPDTNYPSHTIRPVPDVDCWLKWAHPLIGNTIVWHNGPAPNQAVMYHNWTWEQKAQLINAVSHYWYWFEYGYMPNWGDPYPIDNTYGSDFPVNLGSPSSTDTTISQADAWNYYIDSVALSLAAQLGHWYQWDVRFGTNIFNWDLKYLFDSEQMFAANYWAGNGTLLYRVVSTWSGPDFPIHGAVTLTSPMASLELLMRQQGLVRNSMDGTLYAALDWGRDNLAHFNGPPERSSEERVWQYSGLPPVLKMITGTVTTEIPGQNWGDTGFGVQNWTMGCHGTSGFYKAVLRTVNIPVKAEDNTWHSGMSFPMWPPWGVAGHITHSDQLYSRAFRDQNLGLPGENPTTTPTSVSNLIVDDSEYNFWFDPAAVSWEQRVANVNRGEQRYVAFTQPVPTTLMMQLYCSDLAAGRSHANSRVYNEYFFSSAVGLPPSGPLDVVALENAFFWDWLEWRRISYPGGCAAF